MSHCVSLEVNYSATLMIRLHEDGYIFVTILKHSVNVQMSTVLVNLNRRNKTSIVVIRGSPNPMNVTRSLQEQPGC